MKLTPISRTLSWARKDSGKLSHLIGHQSSCLQTALEELTQNWCAEEMTKRIL